MNSDMLFNVTFFTGSPWGAVALALGLGTATTLALLATAHFGRRYHAALQTGTGPEVQAAGILQFRAHPDRIRAAARLAEVTAPRQAEPAPAPITPTHFVTRRPASQTGARPVPLPFQAAPVAQFDRIDPPARLSPEDPGLQPVLEKAVAEFGDGHILCPQARLADVLQIPGDNPDPALDETTRLDFAIVDRCGTLIVAIDFRHRSRVPGTGQIRDPRKHQAIASAGVPYVEIVENFKAEDIRRAIRWVLGRNSGGAPNRPISRPLPEDYTPALS